MLVVVLKYTFWVLSTALAFAGAWLVKFTKQQSDRDRLELTPAGRIALPIAVAALSFGFVLQIAENIAASASKLEAESHRTQLENRFSQIQELITDVTEHIVSIAQHSPEFARSLAADPKVASDFESFFDLAQQIDPSLRQKVEHIRRFASGETRLSPIEAAVARGDQSAVKSMLEQGANVDERGDLGITPLQRAAAEGKLELVKLLLDKGAAVDARGTFLGQTALMKAAMSGRADIVRLLIDRSAQINAQDKYGETALFHAACFNRIAVVKILLSDGASPTIANNQGKTPLVCAENFRAKDTAEMLRRLMRH